MKSKAVFTIIVFICASTLLISCSAEKKAILQKFISGKTKVLVCPVHILSNQVSMSDTILSQKIVEYINDKKYAVASKTLLSPVPNNEWRINEAKILTESINLFIDFVKKNNFPDDTYILYPEILRAGQNSEVKAVHYCLLNNKGEVAIRGLINSNRDEFKKVNPKTDFDCITVFIKGFEENMNEK